METKVNDYGVIPKPRKVKYNGQVVYYRELDERHFFRKYQGIGMSVSILADLDADLRYLIKYKGKSADYYYISSISKFKHSNKEYDNNGDIQKIVSFKDMCLIKKTQINE